MRELYRDELLELLRPHFPFVRLYGQKLLFQSAIWTLDGSEGAAQVATSRHGEPQPGFDYEPLYFIAVCSKRPADTVLPQIALFGDSEESVYRHYNGEVRKNMAAGARIAELETGLDTALRERDRFAAALEHMTTAAPRRSWWRRWFGPVR